MTQKSLLLFGARSGAGLCLARLALSRGWSVTAALRPSSDPGKLVEMGCRIVQADAMDKEATSKALASTPAVGAVVSAMSGAPGGPPVDGIGNIHLVDAARAAKAERFLLVSSLGAGDSRAFASSRLIAAIGPILDAKSEAESHLRAHFPRHVILRPGGLTDDFASGEGALYAAPDLHGSLAREDLALLILQCLDGDGAMGRTLTALDRTRRSDEVAAPEFDPSSL